MLSSLCEVCEPGAVSEVAVKHRRAESDGTLAATAWRASQAGFIRTHRPEPGMPGSESPPHRLADHGRGTPWRHP